jgi:hypothetical protein
MTRARSTASPNSFLILSIFFFLFRIPIEPIVSRQAANEVRSTDAHVPIIHVHANPPPAASQRVSSYIRRRGSFQERIRSEERGGRIWADPKAMC